MKYIRLYTDFITEGVKAGVVNCSGKGCTWHWNLADGLDGGETNPYLCHKCWHDNTPIKYTIKNIEGNDYIVKAMISGKIVGELYFIKSQNRPVLIAGSISVDPSHRRKGIASSMYEFAEKELGIKFVKSEDVLTQDGKLLWNNPNRKFGLNEKCWTGYKRKGTKTMFGKKYPNCVKKSKN